MPDHAANPEHPSSVQDQPLVTPNEELFQRLFEFAPDAILVVNRFGQITRANAQTENLFGYTRDELLGQPIEILIPQRFANRHIGHRSRYLEGPRTRTMGADLELFGRRKDESEIPVDIMLSPLETQEGPVVVAVVRDVTRRKQAEQRVIDSLREKEVLLREIHHRVKNNLAVISSLFYLQSTYTEDQETIRTLEESQNRVRSMALVHETLYRSESFAELEFAEYAQELTNHLFHTYGVREEAIRVQTELEPVSMGIDTAIPCGLILNELVSNALKHAFPDGQTGALRLGLHPIPDGQCLLLVADTGVGLPIGWDMNSTRSLGMRLIRSLTKQIDGTFELISTNPGTEARLQFQVAHDKH